MSLEATTPEKCPPSPNPFTHVSISDTETWEKNKRFTVYKVVVNSGNTSWFIFRRYNEFHSLYDKMKKLYPDAHLKLPGKKLFGNFDPDFIKHRREGLHDFIQKLITHPRLSQNREVQVFLNVTNQRQTSSSEEDEEQNGKDSMHEPMNLGPSEKPHARPSDFEFLKVIGKGSFGKVLLAKHKVEDRIYAVKVLSKAHIMKRNEVKHIMSERNVLLQNIKHPFLVGLHYSFQTKDKLYFVLDYVNGGELFFHLQRERCFSEPRARFYAAEIASALGYLHSLKIIYRDLKPENILLDYMGHIVLTDFGLCKEGIEGMATTSTFCGTPEPPFYSRNVSEMYDAILHKPLRLRTNVSLQARSILEGMLQKDRTMRLGFKNDFEDIKSHIFFSPINWKSLDERKIKPLYNPNVDGQMDLKHFDPEFVKEPVPASVGRSAGSPAISASVQEADNVFQGFSYVPPAEDAFS